MRALVLGAFLGLVSWGALADDRIITLMSSTPDISVGATSTVEAIAPGGRATWLYLKNDCAHQLHFDLRGQETYNLTLHASEDFQAGIALRTVAASADGNAPGACTFTILFGN